MKTTQMTLIAVGAAAIGLTAGMFIAAPPEATIDAASEPAETPKQWTCSMHPQVRLPEAGDCPICGMDLIEADAGAGGGAPRVALSAQASQLAAIETAVVERRSVSVHLTLVGKVSYDETRLARITARFGGRIERMFVDYSGTRVERGDHLYELYSPELLVAQQELIEAVRRRRRLQGAGSGSSLIGATATLEAAREKLRLWGLQRWQIDRIVQLGRPQRNVTIYAPIGGIVTLSGALEGSYVNTGTPVFEIADLEKVWVVLDAYESDVQWLRYGQRLTFDVASYPGERFEGSVSFVSPTMDPKTRTVKVRVNVANPGLRLKPGMFVRATVDVPIGGGDEAGGQDALTNLAGKWICPMHPEVQRDRKGTCSVCGMKLVKAEAHWLVGPALAGDADGVMPLVVPHSAPLWTGRRSVVFVEEAGAEEPTYALREVVLGTRAGDWYVVVEGLAEGERVVREGAFKLDSALMIRGDRSATSPDHAHGSGSGPSSRPASGPASRPGSGPASRPGSGPASRPAAEEPPSGDGAAK